MQTIVDVAAGDSQLSMLVEAVRKAGLIETLRGSGPFTLFAPTDSAFALLPLAAVYSLFQDVSKLKSMLSYHVVSGKVLANDVSKVRGIKTLHGGSVRVGSKHGVQINNASIRRPDIEASNGVIHSIDRVLIPT